MSKSTISNARMEAFAGTIMTQVEAILGERSDDMLKAWHESMEEAQGSGDDCPPLKLSFSVNVDLAAAKITTALTFTTRYKTTLSADLPDPNQPNLFDPPVK